MKNKTWWDMDQIVRYLKYCIIRIEATPIMVCDIMKNDNLEFELGYYEMRKCTVSKYGQVTTPKIKFLKVKNKKINFNPVPLGYVTSSQKKETFSLERVPKRMWKIGLTTDNLDIKKLNGTEIDYFQIMYGEDFHNTITRNYPSVEECVNKVENEKWKSSAFSSNFCVAEDLNIFYKRLDQPVGKINNNLLPDLLEDFLYLKELLEEDLHEKY